MVEWKKRIITGIFVVPVLFYALCFKMTGILIIHGKTILISFFCLQINYVHFTIFSCHLLVPERIYFITK